MYNSVQLLHAQSEVQYQPFALYAAQLSGSLQVSQILTVP